MKKIAIFVEGETELDFVSKLLKEVIGQRNISIDSYKCSGDRRSRQDTLLASSPITGKKYYALIYVSSADNQVNHDIKRKLPTLQAQNFNQIIGLKDLRGERNGREMSLADLPRLELASRVIENYCSPLLTHIVIAVMEIETWFLAETNHYVCIDKRLTKTKVLSKIDNLGFNPYSDDLTLRPKPAEDLKNLYQIVGKSYTKRSKRRERTINCLDYANVYFELKNQVIKLKELITEIDRFFDEN